MRMTITINGAEKDFATKAADYLKSIKFHNDGFVKFNGNEIEISHEMYTPYNNGRLYAQTDIILFTLPEALGYKDYAVKFN
ncbi:MAG TPA: hypothetical protein VI933_03865 [archaeon]|nr:hypothetical protein [archaeon]